MNVTLPQPKKKMTLDDLAAMMKRQFDFMEEKFDARFDSIDERFKSMEEKMDGLGQRFDKIDEIVLQDHRPRIYALEKEVGFW